MKKRIEWFTTAGTSNIEDAVNNFISGLPSGSEVIDIKMSTCYDPSNEEIWKSVMVIYQLN
jgi:hypothetical protein